MGLNRVFLVSKQLFSFGLSPLFCPSCVYVHLSGSSVSLCHSLTFSCRLIRAVAFIAHPPSNCFFLQSCWQTNYSYLGFNCSCSLRAAAEFKSNSQSIQTPCSPLHFSPFSSRTACGSVLPLNGLVLYLCSSCFLPGDAVSLSLNTAVWARTL